VAPAVGVGHPVYKDLPITLSLTASIASLREAVVLPKVSGYLQTVTVRAGDTVTAGQTIAVVDHEQLQAQVNQAQATLTASQAAVQTAQAALASAEAQAVNAVAALRSAEANLANANAGLVKAQAALADARTTYTRTATLVRQGAQAQQNLDDAKATLEADQAAVDQAAAQVRASEAQVAQAQAQITAQQQQIAAARSQVHTNEAQAASQAAALQNAQLGLQYATIVAPFSGVVVSRSLDPGAYVTPGTSTPIVTIADLAQLDVVVNVSESQLAMVHRGDTVQTTVDAYPGRTFTGVVSRVAGGVDPQTRTVQVEIDLASSGAASRPLSSARRCACTAAISAGTQRALVVPLSAVVTLGTQSYVWAVVDGNTTARQVTTGRETGSVVEITKGLTPSDLVVFRGSDLVREGQPVKSSPVGL
jgi:RND family efflux transporter MFP subunit